MPRTPLPWLGGLLVCYLAIPIVAFVVRLAMTHQRGFHDPGLFPALATSVLAASISTAVVTVVGVPLAYLLARSRGRLVSALGVVVQLPLAVPPVMAGLLLVYVVGPYTPVGRFFGGALTGTLAGIVLAQTFVAAPFLVVSARAALASVDPALGEVAATLGHGEVGRFWRVYVPAAAPGIRAGMVLAWLRAFGEYGATVVLAYHPTSLPVYTFTAFSATGLPATVAPTALALGVAVGAVLVGRLARRGWGSSTGRRAHKALLGAPGLVGVAGRRAPGRSLAGGAVPSAPGGAVPSAPGGAVRSAPGGAVRSAPGGAVRSAPGRTAVPRGPSPVGFALDHRMGAFRLEVSHRSRSPRLAVLGPSGSGKSTLLRCLAGLYGASPGPVSFGDRHVQQVPVERRRVGYVAQAFGLFPHLAVGRQLLFAVDADPEGATWWLDRMHLCGLEDRYPRELSGGQRQRVALAQALARSPDVLLLDEPFSALDTPVRRELQRELRRVQRETGVATVVVTHDPEEAALLADEVLVLSDGRVLQRGAVRSVYSRPASPEVARLVGVRNVLPGSWAAGEGVLAAGGSGGVAAGGVAAGRVVIPVSGRPFPAGAAVLWSIWPEDAQLAAGPPAHPGPGRPGGAQSAAAVGAAALPGTVVDVADLGTAVEVMVALDAGFTLEVRERGDRGLEPGDRCVVELPADAVSVWAAEPAVTPGASGSENRLSLPEGARVEAGPAHQAGVSSEAVPRY